MRFYNRQEEEDPRIDLTPLVDTVFLLIIFFMLASSFVMVPGIKVELPQAVHERILREKQEIRVTITKDNEVYIGKEKVDLGALQRVFGERARKAPNTLVVINADSQALHGKVVEVMDLAKTAGLNNLAIATSPKRTK